MREDSNTANGKGRGQKPDGRKENAMGRRGDRDGRQSEWVGEKVKKVKRRDMRGKQGQKLGGGEREREEAAQGEESLPSALISCK